MRKLRFWNNKSPSTNHHAAVFCGTCPRAIGWIRGLMIPSCQFPYQRRKGSARSNPSMLLRPTSVSTAPRDSLLPFSVREPRRCRCTGPKIVRQYRGLLMPHLASRLPMACDERPWLNRVLLDIATSHSSTLYLFLLRAWPSFTPAPESNLIKCTENG